MFLSSTEAPAIGHESDSLRVDQYTLIRMRGQGGQLGPDPFTLVHRVSLSTWLHLGLSANHASPGCVSVSRSGFDGGSVLENAWDLTSRTTLDAGQVTSWPAGRAFSWYSGKAHEHAGNVQALSAPNGLPTLADSGYDGAGICVLNPIKTPADGQTLSTDNRTYNRLLRGLRALGERGFALFKGRWRILATSPAPPSSSPISNTATYRKFSEITSLNEFRAFRLPAGHQAAFLSRRNRVPTCRTARKVPVPRP